MVGRRIVDAILDLVRKKSRHFFALVRPGYLSQDLADVDAKKRASTIKELQTGSEQFWRSMGFRRVGKSEWLAFTDDVSHPSRNLEVSKDSNQFEESRPRGVMPKAMHIIIDVLFDPEESDIACVRKMQEVDSAEMKASTWLFADCHSETILHLAARSKKAEAVAYLLSVLPHLADVRNAMGYTPLEALQQSLESHRTMQFCGEVTVMTSDDFKGFQSSEIACLASLTGTQIVDIIEVSDQDNLAFPSATDDVEIVQHTLRLKYGCTCGQCIGGFLSPRMLQALLCQAETEHDILAQALSSSGPDWVKNNGGVLGYLTATVRRNMATNKAMRQGFANMCDYIAQCLRVKRLPNEKNVLDWYLNNTNEWPPVTKKYLQRGGTVAAVGTMLFEKTIKSDKWAGHGSYLDMDIVEDDGEELPDCRNDGEFGFVSGMCGYERISP